MNVYTVWVLLLILLVMLPKVDYVLITSLFVCIKMITMLGVFPPFDEPYEVIVCNGTVWQRMVLFLL